MVVRLSSFRWCLCFVLILSPSLIVATDCQHIGNWYQCLHAPDCGWINDLAGLTVEQSSKCVKCSEFTGNDCQIIDRCELKDASCSHVTPNLEEALFQMYPYLNPKTTKTSSDENMKNAAFKLGDDKLSDALQDIYDTTTSNDHTVVLWIICVIMLIFYVVNLILLIQACKENNRAHDELFEAEEELKEVNRQLKQIIRKKARRNSATALENTARWMAAFHNRPKMAPLQPEYEIPEVDGDAEEENMNIIEQTNGEIDDDDDMFGENDDDIFGNLDDIYGDELDVPGLDGDAFMNHDEDGGMFDDDMFGASAEVPEGEIPVGSEEDGMKKETAAPAASKAAPADDDAFGDFF